ncbi:MAG: NAD(P)/FAD-dependent oxidoreductase [Chloroflexi bacterium]|nr:NAD(P)/FAD-dependent oxidoreductase [Chloroflexota bacterium]
MTTSNGAEKLFDITFIGAGPTGLFGAFYAGLREMSAKVIDALPQAGGQLTALYPEKKIYDSPGFPAVLSKDLVTNLMEQAQQWPHEFCFEERAADLRRGEPPPGVDEDSCWVIETNRGLHYTRTVVLCAGIGAFRPIKLRNESVEAFENKGILYLIRDLQAFEGQRVLIIGGGDSALDWALALEPIAEKVTLIHRREGFRAHDSSVNAVKSSSVDLRIFYELKNVEGSESVERAVIFDNRSKEEESIKVDAIILALGFKADLGPIRSWNLETIGRRYVKVNSKMETNLHGVFAAGDVALQEDLDPLNLIVVGFGQVTVAVNYAYTVVKPGGKVFPGHSSEKMADKG